MRHVLGHLARHGATPAENPRPLTGVIAALGAAVLSGLIVWICLHMGMFFLSQRGGGARAARLRESDRDIERGGPRRV